MSKTTTITLTITAGDGRPGTDGDANDDDGAVAVLPPHDEGPGGAIALPEDQLDALGVFARDGSLTVTRSGVCIRLDRTPHRGPTGEVLFAITDATDLTIRDPRPAEDGC
jgi:hypothetical protein